MNRGPGQPPHEPTEKTRAEVSALCSFGVTQTDIAMFLDICEDTLRKHYRRELDTGKIRGNAAMARRLFKAGTEDGSVAAMIFWMKSQAGWRETMDLNLGGTVIIKASTLDESI